MMPVWHGTGSLLPPRRFLKSLRQVVRYGCCFNLEQAYKGTGGRELTYIKYMKGLIHGRGEFLIWNNQDCIFALKT